MNTMNSHRRLLSVVVLALACVIGQGAEARLLRFPAIHGKQIVFGYAGDLCTVPAKHGPTRNLTQTPGIHERNAAAVPG